MTLILGIDPGLQRTGWGLIRKQGNNLSFLGCGVIAAPTTLPLHERLLKLSEGLKEIIARCTPDEAAVEETFVSVNGASTLKLGQARGALLLTLAQANLPVSEYAATLVKKSIVGAGRAEKSQVAMMVKTLLPACGAQFLGRGGTDASDALAVAICHANHSTHRALIAAQY